MAFVWGGIRLDGLGALIANLDKSAAFAESPFADAAMRDETHAAVLARFRDAFETEGSAIGSRWPALEVSYAAWKQSQVGQQPLLVFSGRFRDSMLNKGSMEHVFAHTSRRVIVGSDVPWAPWHQTGAGRLRERPTVAMDDTLAQQLAALAVNRLSSFWGGA